MTNGFEARVNRHYEGMSNSDLAAGLEALSQDYDLAEDVLDRKVYAIVPPLLREAASRLRAEERRGS